MSPTGIANAICPGCEVIFGFVVKDGKVSCPVCGFIQPLPIIKIGIDQYMCISCRAVRQAPDIESMVCINCGERPLWRPDSG